MIILMTIILLSRKDSKNGITPFVLAIIAIIFCIFYKWTLDYFFKCFKIYLLISLASIDNNIKLFFKR